MTHNKTIHDLIKTQAEQRPDAIAIVDIDKRELTYKQLYQQVQDIVMQLKTLGIGCNDPVSIVLPNGPEMAVAFLSVASGATCAPLNPAYKSQEFEFFLTDLGAKALITYADPSSPVVEVALKLHIPVIQIKAVSDDKAGTFTLSESSQPLSPQNDLAKPDDVALVLYTSGTTSRPKIVPLTHRNLFTSACNISQTLQLTPSDCCLNIMPLFHIHGLMAALLASVKAGASVVCTPGFYPPRFFDWLNHHRPSWYTAVPTMHQAILSRAGTNQDIVNSVSLRFIRSSSSSLSPQIMHDLESTFQVPVIEAYGMTEAAHQIASNPLPPETRKPGSVGKAAGPDVAIMAEDNNLLLTNGETGEIVIRGLNVTLGYGNNSMANSKAFVDGWFRTGDQGYIDQEGYLYITARLKEIINRGGEKITPREVDEVLLKHPAVAQALTFPIPDEILGEDLAAAIVLHQNRSATQQEIRRFVGLHLANFKIPRLVIFLDEIPKGSTGKLQRIGLADKLGITVPQQAKLNEQKAIIPPSTKTEKIIFEIWEEVLEKEGFSVNDQFSDLGGESIMATKLAMRIRQTLEIEFPLVEFFEASTVREQANLIEKWTAFPHEHTGQKLTSWNNRVEEAWATLETLIPEKSVCILVDECQLELNQSKFLPFLEKNGEYWGVPSDTAVAIRELKRMRRQLGCSFIAFAWPCFWWLEHYSGFAKYLQLNFTCVLENDLLTVFDLQLPK